MKLRAHANQSSSNSSRPPSSDPPWHVKRKPPKRPSGRKPVGQPDHKPHHRERLEPTEEFDVHAPECCHCGGSLGDETVIGEAPHVQQVIDIEIRPVGKDFHLLVHQCPAVTEFAAAFKIDPKRSRAAFHRLLGEDFEGLLGSDRWRPYASIPPVRPQLCHAHLRRDIQALIDRGGAAEDIGKALLAQNDAMFSLWHAFNREEFDRPALVKAIIPAQQRTRALLEGDLTHTDHKVKVLCKDLLRLWPSLWGFVASDGVDPTNNVAERTLRPAVLLRKCNGGTRSKAGAHFTERMLTASTTANRQEIGLFAWLCQATEAAMSYTPPPGLLAAVEGGG